MENSCMDQDSLPFAMGYSDIPSKDFNHHDHRVTGCVRTYHSSSLRINSRPPTPGIVSRGIGLEGFCSVLAGLWGSGTGSTTLTENVHTINITKVANRRALELGAAFLILFSFVACPSTFPRYASDYALMVPNGSLYRTPASLAVSCSSMQCRNINLMLGNVTVQQSSAGCNVTSCSYGGFVNGTIITMLSTSLQPRCPGPQQFPALIAPPTVVGTESISIRRPELDAATSAASPFVAATAATVETTTSTTGCAVCMWGEAPQWIVWYIFCGYSNLKL